MTHSLPPAPLTIRGDGRFRAILDRADGFDASAPCRWPARPSAMVIEAERPSLMNLLPKPPALPPISVDAARRAVAMGSGFAASVVLVLACGILKPGQAPPVTPVDSRALPRVEQINSVLTSATQADPQTSRASAFAVPTLLPMLDTATTLVAELPKPVVTFQRTLAVRSVAVAQIPIAEDRAPQVAATDGTSVAPVEPELRQEPIVHAGQPVKRRRKRTSAEQPPQQRAPEKVTEQVVAEAPRPPVRRNPWKYDSVRSALGLAEDRR